MACAVARNGGRPLAGGQRSQFDRLFNDWDDAVADDIFADNVALDESYGRRRSAVEAMRARAGQWHVQAIKAANQAEGRVVLTAEDSENAPAIAEVAFSLAPTVPPRIQWYSLSETLPTDDDQGV